MAGYQIADNIQADTITNKAGTGSPTLTYGVKTDTIAEKTSAAGVTIDSVLLKDGGGTFTNTVTGTNFVTSGGDISGTTSGAAYELFVAPGYGIWLVWIGVPGSDPNSYGSYAVVINNGSATLARLIASNGTSSSITISGQSIKATQTSGASQTIRWGYTKLAF